MEDLFYKIFANIPSETAMDMYCPAHLILLAIAFSISIIFYFTFFRKSKDVKQKALDVVAIIMLVLYLADFGLQPFWNGGLCIDKFPFHICTLLSILICFVSFNDKCKKFKNSIAVLSFLSAIMFLFIPVNYFNRYIMWYSYSMLQPFIYHSLLFTWGLCTMAFGLVDLPFKKCWHTMIIVVLISLWATLGNLIYDQNYFFLRSDISEFTPQWLLLPALEIASVLCIMAVYGGANLIKKLHCKNSEKIKTIVEKP